MVHKIEALADLLELQALTTKGSQNERQFFELYHAACELRASANYTISIDTRLAESLERLGFAFLDGVRTMDSLLEMFGEWVWHSGEALLPRKGGDIEQNMLLHLENTGNLRRLELFLQTAQIFLSGFETFLEVIKSEDDESIRHEIMGLKLKPVKA